MRIWGYDEKEFESTPSEDGLDCKTGEQYIVTTEVKYD